VLLMGCTDIHCNHFLRGGNEEVDCGKGMEVDNKEERKRGKEQGKTREKRKRHTKINGLLS